MESITPLDQCITVTFSEDKTASYIEFKKKDDSLTFTASEVERLLKAYGIVYGVDYDILSDIAAEPRAYFHAKVLIASGDKPIEGEDGQILYLFDDKRKSTGPAELAGGNVDLREVISLSNARKGELIARRIPAKRGIDGRTVTGEPILAPSGKEKRFKIGQNVVVDKVGLHIYAAIDGLVTETEGDKLNVFPLYEVNGNVDYSIGNIDFVGSVIIRGNVLNGFRVKASGDISVIGGVEAAELYAGGSIDIKAGMMGQNKSLIKAGKSVKTSFIQEGNVEAGDDILVHQSIMHSQLKAGRNIVCSGNKGLIVGGIIQAGQRVTARTIGNSMSTVTVIEAGVHPQLRNELAQLKTSIKSHLENISKTEKALYYLDQLASSGSISKEKLEMRIKLNATKKQLNIELEDMQDRVMEIEKLLDETTNSKVVVNNRIYGGTKIVIGRYTRFITDPASKISLRIIDGEITMVPN
jgi:uncharacterized protein (DUF342 family)